MKNLSKVLAVVLAMALCLSMVGVVSAFDDVAETASYSEAVSILNSLGILNGYEDGTFGPDKTITRAEFAAVVCRAAGFGETLGGQVVFNDVPANHWASGYIALAAQQGIVNGYGNGNFGPEDPVKYQEAIKMVVVALGYAPAAETNGGYPGGHQVVAAQMGVLKNITGAVATEPATRAVVAQMVYNSLEVPLMVQKTYGTNAQYGYSNTLLLNKMGITKFYGSVYDTSVSNTSIKEGKVQIDVDRQVTAIEDQSSVANLDPTKDVYTSANPYIDAITTNGRMVINVTDAAVDAAAKELLDYAVVMYVKNADADNAELLAIAKRGSRNQEATFISEDIYDNKTDMSYAAGTATTDAVASGDLYVYTDKDNEKYNKYKINLSKLYVNGVEQDASAFEAYAASTATADIRLLCNTADGDEYTIAYVTAYTDLIVKDINAKSYKLFTNGRTVILDEEDDTYRFDIVKDGEEITFADIQVNDVISVAAGEWSGNNLVRGTVVVTSNQVTGTVDTYNADYVTVAGTKYPYQGITVGDGGDVAVGDQATFYINARGVIVGVDTEQTNTSLKYGFATVMAQGSGVETSYQIKVLTTDEDWVTYSINTRVIVNDNAAATASTVAWATEIGKTGLYEAGTASTADGKTFINKVVAYEVNADNKITKIFFEDVTNKFTKTSNYATGTYYEDMEALGSVSLDDDTAIFSVASGVDLTATTTIDDDKFTVAKKDALIDRNVYDNGFRAFNLDKNQVAAVITGVDLVGAINEASAFFVVADVEVMNNAAGERGKRITGFVNGEEAELFVADTASVEKLTLATDDPDATDAGTITASTTSAIVKGSAIIFSKNAAGEANTVRILVAPSDVYGVADAFVDTNLGNVHEFSQAGSDYKYVMMYVRDRNNTTYYVDKELDTAYDSINRDSRFSISGVAGATFDSDRGTDGKVVAAAAGDINYGERDETSPMGDVIFARVFNDNVVKDFVAYKSINNPN